MSWTIVSRWQVKTQAITAVAVSAVVIMVMMCLGIDQLGDLVAHHRESFGPSANAGGREPAPGLGSALYAVAIRATMSSRRTLARLVPAG